MSSTTEYRSSIGARESYSAHHLRSPGAAVYGSGGGGGRVLKIVTEMGASSLHGISPAFGSNAASAILESREREKREMQDLNDRLGSYIERVRFLEAENRRLAKELEDLRGNWGSDTKDVKIRFASELSEARRLIDDTAKDKANIEVLIARLNNELNEYRMLLEEGYRVRDSDRERMMGLEATLVDVNGEIGQLQRRIKSLTEELGKYGRDNTRLNNELKKSRDDFDKETLDRIGFQNQVQTMLEEIEFLRRIHDQEVKELQALAAPPQENKEYFRNELSLAIRDIKNEYDNIAAQGKADMESWYKLKVQEVQSAGNRDNMESNFQREEVTRLRTQINTSREKLSDLETRNATLEKQVRDMTYQLEDEQRQYEAALNDRDAQVRKMREEASALMYELQSLLNTKQTLDAEIAIYRKMLEGEESRAGLRSMVEQVVKTHSIHQSDETESTRNVRGERELKTSFQRSAKGNVTIAETHPEGKYIILENTHRTKDEQLDHWRLKRRIDGRREILYTFPDDITLRAGNTVTVWVRGAGGRYDPPRDLVFDEETSWGTGNNVQTILYNPDGEEKATLVQRTMEETR